MSINISFNSTNLYRSYTPDRKGNGGNVAASGDQQAQNNGAMGRFFPASAGTALEEKNQSIRDYQEMRRMVRDLKRTPSRDKTEEAEKPQSLVDTLLTEDEEEEKDKVKTPVNYNYKEVSNKIQRAKTSVSAEHAYLSAKRKTLQLRRKIAAEEGDPEELQMALNHARSMELVARKKKHHLELEEMVERTQKHDEIKEKEEEAADRVKGMLINAGEEELTKREDEILEERQETMEETAKELRESGAASVDDMLSELNKMLADMGEKELEELETAMEMLEDLEFLDPHMSEEELKEVKIKHRAAESKALVKADMDYLKAMIKHQLEAGKTMPGMSSGVSSAGAASFAAPVSGSVSPAVPAVTATAPSIDVQV
ncbi:MAG: hypothetical protein K6B44_06110 [Lachnospiraceae bacterium]|nr:hypothetical protein [Lachnospiraceae bacterium]